MSNCKNCNQHVTEKYCSHCGQQLYKKSLTVKMVFADLIQALFSWESTLIVTLKGLLTSPGELVKSYLSGKRKSYFAPVQFFLMFMTLYLLVMNFFGEQFFQMINTGLQLEQKDLNRTEVIQNLVRDNQNILYFILTPIVALFIKTFFRKLNYNYAELLVFSLFIMGVGFFLSTIIVILSLFHTKLFMLRGVIIFGYLPIAIMQFTDSNSFTGFVKSFLTIFISYICYIVIVLLLVLLYVFIFIA